jgi:hypothetical protein
VLGAVSDGDGRAIDEAAGGVGAADEDGLGDAVGPPTGVLPGSRLEPTTTTTAAATPIASLA